MGCLRKWTQSKVSSCVYAVVLQQGLFSMLQLGDVYTRPACAEESLEVTSAYTTARVVTHVLLCHAVPQDSVQNCTGLS